MKGTNLDTSLETLFLNHDISPRKSIRNITIIVHKRRQHHHIKWKYQDNAKEIKTFEASRRRKNDSKLIKGSSMLEFKNKNKVKIKVSRSDHLLDTSRYRFKTNYFVNVASEYPKPECLNLFRTPQRIYRCQLSTQDESCCCSCNSDAMFEVMKSLYDCYKKKNCDHCNCILCGHLPREERKLGEIRKSGVALATASVDTRKQKAEKKKLEAKTKKAEKDMIGKTAAEKEQILKDLARSGASMPEGKTASEKELIKKVKTELGVLSAAKIPSEKVTPLEGKSRAQKEKILKSQAEAGLPLPEGRTASERALIAKVKAEAGVPSAVRVPSEKLRKAKAAGLLTPLEGKTPEQKEKILKGLAMSGIPLPEGKTASEKKLIDKVRTEIGLPPEPKTSADKKKYQQALASGIVTPLEGKSRAQKEKILKSQAEAGLPLPEGRTASERALIAKVKAEAGVPSAVRVPSEKLRKAKAAGLLTPLEGKTPEQKEKILKGMAMSGVPLPEGKTASEKKLIDKVRTELGLPPEPKTSASKKKYQQALAAGIITPLEGKSNAQKEKILKSQAEAGLPLPEGRTASERAMIAKIKAEAGVPSAVRVPSEKLRKAKAAGFLTPLEGKTPEQKENILRGLAMSGIPLPEGKTASEKKLIDKVRAELGLPPEPKTSADKNKYQQAFAAGLITPLEGKSKPQKEKILRRQAEAGLPLPEGRTASERALIAKVKAEAGVPSAVRVPSEKLRKAKAAGVLTPLEGKTPEQKEKILRGLAMSGAPLPEGKTASEKKLIDKVRADLGLPPEPKSSADKNIYQQAFAAGLITPLEGKSNAQKEKILRRQAEAGLPLPEGRTASEKAIIAKVKAASLGRPALPPDKLKKLDKKTAKVMKEGKGPSDECICGLLTPESDRVSVKKMQVPKTTSERLKAAKGAGFLTPLEGKTPEQKEKILKSLAQQGLPLPEGKTASEKKLIDKVRTDLGLPPEPKTTADKKKYQQALASGIITPLEGKSKAQKEKILKSQAEAGLLLPEGRTASERALIAKVKAEAGVPSAVKVPSEKLRKAKAAGFLTPLEGKTPEQKEKILRGLAISGIPLPEGKTASEKKLIDKVRTELGLPPEPKTSADKKKYQQALAAGIITPLEGKSRAQKEKILKSQAEAGLPLPEGRTASERAMIAKIKAEAGVPSAVRVPSEKLRKAKAAGFLTPLEGKTPEQKEKILRGLAMSGVPLPEGKTASEKKLIDKIRTELGLPPEPKTSADKKKYQQALAAGIITPLEGKSRAQKEKILKSQAEAGLPLPEGRTASEKALIDKIKAEAGVPTAIRVPSEKLRKAKAAGFLTPLEGKTPEQKEKILRGLAMSGVPLPEGKTASEKKLIDKIRTELGLPPEPKTSADKKKYQQALAAGIITPLEGKSRSQKEKILKSQAEAGLPLPEGRTASEKALIDKIKAEAGVPTAIRVPSEKLRKAKAAGFLTPLEGKTPEQKEKILRGLAMSGVPLPEGKTASEKKLIDKIRTELGLPPEPKTSADKKKYQQALAAGIITPLEGKTRAQKEKILKSQAEAGLPLPEGRTASEKALIDKIKAEAGVPTAIRVTSEKLRKAKAAGFLTPLEGKTRVEGRTASEKAIIAKAKAASLGRPALPPDQASKLDKKTAKVMKEGKGPSDECICGLLTPESERVSLKKTEALKTTSDILTPLEGKTPEQKEKILTELAKQGLPLPEGKTPSEKALIAKVKAKTARISRIPSAKLRAAKAAGLLTPLEGKTLAQKEKILKGLAQQGLPLPEGKTPSEKALIARIKAETAPISKIPLEKLRSAKAAGLLTPLEGKTPAQKEKIIRGLAQQGLPLPEGKTQSEKDIIEKVRKDMGLPVPPTTPSAKEKFKRAQAAGLITPLKGKTPAQKEKILKSLAQAGVSLPEGKTPSEKALIAKVQAETPPSKIPSAKLRAAKAAGLLTPLEGKSSAQKEKIIRGLAKQGLPLPEGKTQSEKDMIGKVRKEMGLPVPPTTPSAKEKFERAQAAGLITPLEGKTPAQKEKILKSLALAGVPLPEGKTPSEKALIAKVKAQIVPLSKLSSTRLKAAKAAGLLTPLEGKTPAQKEKILIGLAKQGIPLPEGKTPSEKALIAKVKAETARLSRIPAAKLRAAKAAGLLTPLEGKTSAQKEKILKGLVQQGLPLPEGKTPSEKALIAKVQTEKLPSKIPSAKLRAAKAAGLLTPLEGKTPAQKEKIIRGLAKQGLPLPEGTTQSEKDMIRKVRKEMGLPVPPKTPSAKERFERALAAGLITPLEGKTLAQREKILKGLAQAGVPLPEGRTPSERALIAKLQAETQPSKIPSAKLKAAKTAGLLTPLEGKTLAQKEKILKGLAEQGLPLPEGKTDSEKALIEKIMAEVKVKPSKRGPPIPLSKEAKALDKKTAKVMKEGKGPSDECICGILTPESDKLSAKAAAKIPSEKLRAAKAAGLLTPLQGKTPAQKEKILRGLAKQGLPFPEGKTQSEKDLIEKVRKDMGLPVRPKTPSAKEKFEKAQAAGLITPLEGKTLAQKEKILKSLAQAGVPLPEGRTPSERALIAKLQAETQPSKIPSAKLKAAKTAGLLTPLEGKTSAQKEKILKGLVQQGLPLPEGKTPSEKALIAKVQTEKLPSKIPSAKLRAAKAAGLLTPLEGKTPAQKEKIIRGLAKQGLPLPEGKTQSEKDIIGKVRKEMGLPVPLKTPSAKEKFERAQAAGLITPLEGKTLAQREKILKGLAQAGVPLPEGRTPSEKALIDKLKAETAPLFKIPSAKLKAAKAAGLLTPLEGKTPAQKEKIIRGLAQQGLPLPEGRTQSEKNMIEKVRKDMGLPIPPKSPSAKEKFEKAQAAGLITPLEGKTLAQKENILKGLAQAGVPLPEGRTPSEKALIDKVKAETAPLLKIPSAKLKAAKAAGLSTPLEGKTPAQKEKIIRGLAQQGLPLPEGRTQSEKNMIEKVRKDMGLPIPPKSPSAKEKFEKAQAAGLITPLEGKTLAQREKILKGLAQAGVPLPEGRTPSEKALIDKVKAETAPLLKIPSAKLKAAKAAGLSTPLEGKTPAQKEKIIRGLAQQGLPLPEGKTQSEKDMIEKVRKDMGLPVPPKSPSAKEKFEKAQAAGLITPLEGKTLAQKEKILKGLAQAGVPLPEGKTASEKALIERIKAEVKAKPSKKGPPIPLSKEAKALDQKTAKVMKEGKGPSDECICGILTPESDKLSAKAAAKIPSEKMRAAKTAGLLTPLEGKTPAQKEKILRGLAKQGLPFPEGKTQSEKDLIEKVRKDMGLPVRPKTPSAKEKFEKAQAAGLITPLEGKTSAQKEKILKSLAQAGIPLPEGRTPSEKALTDKVKAESVRLSKEVDKISSKKLRKAKAAGLLTPLEGKSLAQKEKILKGLADSGLPLPEGKTPSEKALVQKVKTEYGIPKAVTPSEKEIVRKAKAEGLLTPLAGKSAAEKETILKGLAEAGLPMPEGKTPSEKELIKKVRTSAGLPPERTTSEKLGKVKKMKSKKIGAAASKRIGKGVGGSGLAKAGIAEEFEDIIKTTTCDRGCGCDKKKIRFKHSYVKIRVTSPDISSLCPCPDECVPGVKGGVLVDNEGIKVTVGSALGYPSFSSEYDEQSIKVLYSYNSFNLTDSSVVKSVSSDEITPSSRSRNSIHDFQRIGYKNIYLNENFPNESYSSVNIHKKLINLEKNIEVTDSDQCETLVSRYLITCSESYLTLALNNTFTFEDDFYGKKASAASLNTMSIVKTESSLSFSTKSNISIDTMSIISIHNSNINPTSSHYLYYQYSDCDSGVNAKGSEYSTNVINYSAMDSFTSESEPAKDDKVLSDTKTTTKKNISNDMCILRMSHVTINRTEENAHINKKVLESGKLGNNRIIIKNDMSSDEEEDILTLVNEILAKKAISDASSIYVVVPSTDDDKDSTDTASSKICIRLSDNFFQKNSSFKLKCNNRPRNSLQKSHIPKRSQGINLTSRGKQHLMKCKKEKPCPKEKRKVNEAAVTISNRKTGTDYSISSQVQNITNCQEFSMDTTQDRPCCCPSTEMSISDGLESDEECMAYVVSELLAPIIASQGAAQGLSEDTYLNMNDKYKTFNSSPLACGTCQHGNFHDPCVAPIIQNAMGMQQQKLHSAPCRCCPAGKQALPPTSPRMNTNNKTAGYGPVEYRPTPRSTQPQSTTFQNVGCGPNECRPAPTSSSRMSTNNQTAGCGPVEHRPPSRSTQPQNTTFQNVGCGPNECRPAPTSSSRMSTNNQTAGCGPVEYRPPSRSTQPQYTKFQNVGCGPNECRPAPIIHLREMGNRHKCLTCGRPTMKDGKKISCLCSGIEKNVQLPNACPCEAHSLTETTPGTKKKSCVCDDKGNKNKKVICECPEVIEEPPPPSPLPSVEDGLLTRTESQEKEFRKMKSNLTQTTSGFKFNFKKRPIIEEEMSFEDALLYFEMYPDDTQTQQDDLCLCDENGVPLQSTGVLCECPKEEEEATREGSLPAQSEESEVKGLKLFIGGKGSGSPGLTGICCFDMLQDSNGLLLLHD